jgi:hypothetical protein
MKQLTDFAWNISPDDCRYSLGPDLVSMLQKIIFLRYYRSGNNS